MTNPIIRINFCDDITEPQEGQYTISHLTFQCGKYVVDKFEQLCNEGIAYVQEPVEGNIEDILNDLESPRDKNQIVANLFKSAIVSDGVFDIELYNSKTAIDIYITTDDSVCWSITERDEFPNISTSSSTIAEIPLTESNYKQIIDLLIEASIIQLKYLNSNDFISLWSYRQDCLEENGDPIEQLDNHPITAQSLASYIYSWHLKQKLLGSKVEDLTLNSLKAMLYVSQVMHQLKHDIPLFKKEIKLESDGIHIAEIDKAYHSKLPNR